VLQVLDEVVSDAVRLLGVPVAMVGTLNRDAELVRASRGWDVKSIPLIASFTALLRDEVTPVVVDDTTKDGRFAAHPLVSGPPRVRFFAGVPLLGAGESASMFAVLDAQPRVLSAEHRAIVDILGARAADALRHWREHADWLQRIDESDSRFRDFFGRSTDFIMSIDPDGTLLHVNDALPEASGIPREKLLSAPVSQLIDPALRDEFRIALGEVIASGEPKTIETVFITAAGSPMHVEGSVAPKIIDGRAVLARVIFRDISERIEFESELGTARDAALEAARLKTQFLTNVSHEIRTPMNGIVGMLDLLLSTQLNAEQRDFAHQAGASAEQLLAIINNVLHVSALEAGSLGSSLVDFDLLRMMQRIVEVMRVAALGKDVHLDLDYDRGLPSLFRGDQAKLRQALTNLVDNAVKFTEQGHVTVRAKLQTESETHRVVRFEVSDTGIGIDEEDRLLLFEKFSQVEATSTRRFSGVGLGLATARHLVESMGGLIDVESERGRGSTFWFTVPLQKDAADRAPIESADLSFAGKRVLVVDAFVPSRKLLRNYLETTWEMRVDAAEKASDALAMMRRAATSGDPYRAVIFEKMVDMGEIAFAQEVRGDRNTAATGMVLLVGSTANVNEERLRAAGIRACIAKPVSQSELFDALTIVMASDALGRHASPRSTQPIRAAASPLRVSDEMRRSVRVLLVEDNFLNMKLTMSQLQKLGYQAESAANGKEAVDAVGAHDHDIILMDCQMPIMDGYEATREIRRRDGKRARPHHIIAMTANALGGDREKCLSAGMDDYLAKPTKQDELDLALARYFG